jgi:hypothetical protein
MLELTILTNYSGLTFLQVCISDFTDSFNFGAFSFDEIKRYRNNIRNRGGIDMSLKDKLDKLKEGFKSKAPRDAQEIMHGATEDLKNSGIIDHAVKVGDKAPDFTLKNTERQDVSLSTLLGHGAVVLTFYRGNW